MGIFLMLNNYLHDVATALLLASAVSVWVLAQQYRADGGPAVAAFYVRAYRRLTRLAQVSLVWILIGGVPRVLAYRQYEWANAAGMGQVPALVAKHILLGTIVVWGSILWVRLGRDVRAVERGLK